VSIADPEGTEIDAKFVSEAEGELKVLLAPILRFADFPDGVSVQQIRLQVLTEIVSIVESANTGHFISGQLHSRICPRTNW